MPAVDGIASGLDTSALIEATISVARIPMETLEDKQAEVETRIEKVDEFKTNLTSLQTALEALDEASDFAVYTTALSDETAFSVELDEEALPGSYSIEVTALAAAELEVSQGFADSSTAGELGDGDFVITYAGTDTTVAVDASMSLDDLAAAINDQVEGVTAYVMNTGDASTPYRLAVMGNDTGADNSIEIDASSLSGTVPSFTESNSAANAEVTINGVAASSASNTVDGVLPGIEFSLTALTDSPVTMTVEHDMDAVVDKVQDIIDSYNTLSSFYSLNVAYDADAGTRGALFGDSTIRGIMDDLGTMISANYDPDGGYFGVGLIGINTKQTGKLEFDTAEFKAAMESDREGVLNLFTADEGLVHSITSRMDDLYLADDGLLENRTDTLEEAVDDLDDAIAQIELRLENMEERLRAQYTTMETVLGQLQSTQGYLGALLDAS
jgi:flagellar hook-associated protein 2